jgi:hypothetical protein
VFVLGTQTMNPKIGRTINQFGQNWTLKYHLVKLVCGLVNKTTQYSQIGKWHNQ